MEVVSLRIEKELWDQFGKLIRIMKSFNLLSPESTKSSILRDFIDKFIEENGTDKLIVESMIDSQIAKIRKRKLRGGE